MPLFEQTFSEETQKQASLLQKSVELTISDVFQILGNFENRRAISQYPTIPPTLWDIASHISILAARFLCALITQRAHARVQAVNKYTGRNIDFFFFFFVYLWFPWPVDHFYLC